MSLTLDSIVFGYRRKSLVFDGLSLGFDAKATVVLGPNGAGKSTLLGVAVTALRPRAGTVGLDGLDPQGRSGVRQFRRRIAWIPQHVTAVPGLRVREQVAYCGWLKGMTRSAAWDASESALDRVRLTDLASRPSGQLSGGQLRRMAIAQGLVHDADYIVMDEPTAGLDPGQRHVFRELVADLRETAAVVVSTHQTEDLTSMYDDVVVLADGRVRQHGDMASFLAVAPGDTRPEQRVEAAYARLVVRED
ncbi:ATP-binding cassette domain-containing protein [Phytoactinopolyspora limicola]|uniref:ATP-binding cassette domain-containing protein n=1 Tax=Phytoactinopolyspora limicola TaxID=2715536 RepID=UPI00140C52C6|nr:ATP-binding cassette domain-containing protein [Phytoactinopolyspora limicola]